MKKLKQNKGITLIALIITIIVMLILVGVTVNVALNGGLFSKAQKAAKDTQLELDREMLLSAVLGAMKNDATVDFSKLDNNLPNGFTGSDGIYTSSKGNSFKVSLNGQIENVELEIEKIVTENDEEYAYWKTDGEGTIIYWDYPEDKEVPEILVVPCQIGDEKITTIGELALCGVRVQRNEDWTLRTEIDDEGEEQPVLLETDVDENDNPIPTGKITKVKEIIISKGIEEANVLGVSCITNCNNIIIPSTMVVNEAAVGYGCPALTNLTIHGIIGERAFAGLTSITEVTIYGDVGWAAFYDCTSLSSVYLKEGVTAIDCEAFSNCKSLTEITIPSSVDGMGWDVFQGCSNLKAIYVKGKTETPPDLDNDQYNAIGWAYGWNHLLEDITIWDE